MHRFYCRFEHSSNNKYFYHWGGRTHLSIALATYIIHFNKTDIFREGVMNFFNILTRNYIHKYIHLEALKRTNNLKRKAR